MESDVKRISNSSWDPYGDLYTFLYTDTKFFQINIPSSARVMPRPCLGHTPDLHFHLSRLILKGVAFMNRSFMGRKRCPFIAGNCSIANRISNGPLGLPFVRLTWVASLTFVLCFATAIGFGQESASLSGVVKDSTGSSIPNASVVLTNDKTAEVKKAVTGPAGGYSFTGLAAGTYTIQASAPGFAAQHEPIVLAVGQAASLDLALSIAAEVQSVSVSGRDGSL